MPCTAQIHTNRPLVFGQFDLLYENWLFSPSISCQKLQNIILTLLL
jgi:hypothetical protein